MTKSELSNAVVLLVKIDQAQGEMWRRRGQEALRSNFRRLTLSKERLTMDRPPYDSGVLTFRLFSRGSGVTTKMARTGYSHELLVGSPKITFHQGFTF